MGVTNSLERRLYEHKKDFIDDFCTRYRLHYLIYFEHTNNIEAAIAREKQIKNWKRNWKLNLIRSVNPELKDLEKSLKLDAETSSA